MEQLQRLADVIAETYVRDLIRETGSNAFSVDGVSGNIEVSLLSAGLYGNALLSSQKETGRTDEKKAYWLLADLISLDGPEYQLTDHGTSAIRKMTEISLRKQIAAKNKSIH
ncbi:hypothetical protein GNG27_04970 [Leclercia sp. 119287]|uniref:hypothetical protein n=1 Tax=Leclercia sp. 119287 TaxID=2681308 RepID=UPI0012E29344|nr:hypothetical protein [Leclercia sp. 119287]QGU14035.1 hypothetical protein GNG27_04970 [Leclercia sp. 119287]